MCSSTFHYSKYCTVKSHQEQLHKPASTTAIHSNLRMLLGNINVNLLSGFPKWLEYIICVRKPYPEKMAGPIGEYPQDYVSPLKNAKSSFAKLVCPHVLCAFLLLQSSLSIIHSFPTNWQLCLDFWTQLSIRYTPYWDPVFQNPIQALQWWHISSCKGPSELFQTAHIKTSGCSCPSSPRFRWISAWKEPGQIFCHEAPAGMLWQDCVSQGIVEAVVCRLQIR